MDQIASVTERVSVTGSDESTQTSDVERALASAVDASEAITAIRQRPKRLTAQLKVEDREWVKMLREAARERDYCRDLEWLIQSGDSAMGECGTTAAVVGQIERGSVGGSGNLDAVGCYKHPYTDQQLGAGKGAAIGEVELHRHLSAAWSLLKPETRRRLLLRYTAPQAQYRSDEGYGAKDKWVEGSDARAGQHGMKRTGLDPNDPFWAYAALALALTDKPGNLLTAYSDPQPTHMKKGEIVVNRKLEAQRARTRSEAMKRARTASATDHAEWFSARAKVAGVRTFEARVGRKRTALTALPGPKKAQQRARLLRTEAEAWDVVGTALTSGEMAAE